MHPKEKFVSLLSQSEHLFMADYWKSQPRKQCEFCKCWIADNKPSISFHENGKRHKENVAKRLSEISKKSAQDAKHKVQADKDFKKMEEAALKAYMKDIEGNADFTSKLVLEGLEQKQKAAEDAAVKQAEAKQAKEAAKQREKIDLENKRKKIKEKAEKIKWYEARSDDGYSYYWNTDTSETKWETPSDGYISIAEQKILDEADKAKADARNSKRKEKGKPPSSQKRKSSSDSSKAVQKKIQATKIPDSSSKPGKVGIVMGPAPKPTPYGLWKPIEKKVEEQVDLELPNQEQLETRVVTVTAELPKIKFQEKKISRPIEDDEGCSSQSFFKGFKKKGNFRGNVRQRLDTDD